MGQNFKRPVLYANQDIIWMEYANHIACKIVWKQQV